MKIEELQKIEDNQNIYLHYEGLFWRAYNYSAYAFSNNIKQYAAKKKFIKKLGHDIVYIGFPSSVLSTILEICKHKGFSINQNNNLINIKQKNKLKGFENWKNALKISEHNTVKQTNTSLSDRIKSFPIASKTPMEAQQFLYELQIEINGNL